MSARVRVVEVEERRDDVKREERRCRCGGGPGPEEGIGMGLQWHRLAPLLAASNATCGGRGSLARLDAPRRRRPRTASFDRATRCGGRRSRLLVPQLVPTSVVEGRAFWAFGALNATVRVRTSSL